MIIRFCFSNRFTPNTKSIPKLFGSNTKICVNTHVKCEKLDYECMRMATAENCKFILRRKRIDLVLDVNRTLKQNRIMVATIYIRWVYLTEGIYWYGGHENVKATMLLLS